QAGEVVDVLALSLTFNAVTEIDDPAGARLGGSTNNFSGAINLPSPGTYTIRLHADDPSATGTYGVSLTFLTGRGGASLSWGPPATGAVASLAQVDCYTFSANAGESVVLHTTSTNFTPAAFIAGPNGVIAANWVSGTTTLPDLTRSGN